MATVNALLALGAQVVAVSRSAQKYELSQFVHPCGTRGGLSLKSCDVLDRAALAALFKEEAPFDILVSAATGGSRALGPFLEMDIDGFKGSFDKFWGYANVVQLGAPHLSEKGAIVLVSGSPARKPRAGQVALAAVGASVEQFARSIARELAPKRINGTLLPRRPLLSEDTPSQPFQSSLEFAYTRASLCPPPPSWGTLF
eukprot:6205893-Pleurochrysis_carterae.AAC.1